MVLKADKTDCDCPVEHAQIKEAVQALLKVLEVQDKKEDFLSPSLRINLMVTTHKISSKKEKKVLIPLPHPLYSTSSEICVFTKDIDKKDIEKTQDHFEELFNKAMGYTPKIIPLLSLKKDYKSYEAKRFLSNSYELFLGDDRIIRLLPSHTGKHFYRKKKQPLGIDLTRSDIEKEFTSKLSISRWLILGNGNCSMVPVALTKFSVEEIIDNITAAITTIASTVTRGWCNVRSLYIKTDGSMGIPVYLNDEVAEEVNIKDAEEVEFIRAGLKRRLRDDLYAPRFKKRVRKRKKTSTKKEVSS